MTVKRIISGEVLKYRNGLSISGDYETRLVGASCFTLTARAIGHTELHAQVLITY